MLAGIRLITFFFILMLLSSNNFAGYGSTICKQPEFSCYTVKRGETWQKLFPDADQRDLVKRINRMNTSLYRGLRIAIPNSLNAPTLDFSPFDKQIDAPGRKTIIVSLSKLAFGAYNSDGTLEHWGPISAARGYCPDIHHGCHTSLGTFTIYQKEGEGCVSTKFPVGRGGAPMPYCMFFHGGYALHGSYEVPGYNASHGCVRMFVDDARWLNEEFTTEKTTVIIKE